MTKTTNLQLPQWAADDTIKRSDFNAAFAALDTACGNCRIAAGSYNGTGGHGSGSQNSIICGFPPHVVFIVGDASPYSNVPRYHILLRPLSTMNFDTNNPGTVTWKNTGVSWYNTEAEDQLNKSNKTYYYIAIG